MTLPGLPAPPACSSAATTAHPTMRALSISLRLVCLQNWTRLRQRSRRYCLSHPGTLRSRSLPPRVELAVRSVRTRDIRLEKASWRACLRGSPPAEPCSRSPPVLRTRSPAPTKKSTTSDLLALSRPGSASRLTSFWVSSRLGSEPRQLPRTCCSSLGPKAVSSPAPTFSHSASSSWAMTWVSSWTVQLRALLACLANDAAWEAASPSPRSAHLSKSRCVVCSGNLVLLTVPEVTSMSQSAGLSEGGRGKPRPSKCPTASTEGPK
mmetsp:Transcript_117988/g.313927  ORF Transcript_117988/g.313927 Transcript_117988/m.313927 type:complete len:265 (-) Transcript_117988:1128-1922(-)